MTEPAAPPAAPRTGRSLTGFYVALGVIAVLAGVFYLSFFQPYFQVRRMVEACYARRLPKSPFGGLFRLDWTDGEAAEAIASLGGPARAARKLGFYLRLPDRWAPGRQKALAVNLLVDCGPDAVPHLIAVLKADDERLRYPAVTALGKIGDARAVEPLSDVASQDPSLEIRALAAEALTKIRGGEGLK